MRLQAVIFDFDGVIANSEPLHLRVYQLILAEQGLTLSPEDYYARYLGYDDVAAFGAMQRAMGFEYGAGGLEALLARKTAIFRDLARTEVVLFPGAAECLRDCAAEVPVAVASGALRGEIEQILDATGLLPLVPVIVASGDTPESKPAPDPYRRAVELLSARHGRALEPSRVVAIEDSRWGIASARGAGLRCVAVTTSYPAADLVEADLVRSGLADLTLADLDSVCRPLAESGA